ncbi:uncharacterized protein LOC109713567 isoform X1 [Ananas comosus]|uniref:Uncharacterized protein LOC109713567 isoform X1 n=1 Tax=Ananas comosus TaxID=4615 RepID=A0A6P5FAM8_ANACO|nr:uncharacterized protein LOC109713567 isoform X1 [Ananas comosus]
MGNKYEGRSNLQSFLDCITPAVETHFLPKQPCFRTSKVRWRTAESDTIGCFSLAELWEQYYEWSAYGAGTAVRLPNGEKVVQYYVPYLSGIQLYTEKAFTASRSFNGDSGADYWSDDDDNAEKERLSRSWSAVSEDSGFSYEGSWVNRKRPGHLYFEFFEICSPYGRIPFVDKIYELAQNFPGLTVLTSAELSPASWMSVAWYPIYHIPTVHTVRDLSACFLTYHSISSLFQENTAESVGKGLCRANGEETGTRPDEKGARFSLPPFGLATYKTQGSLWNNPETGDNKRMVSLFSAADSWLKQLGVQHHDFNYFITHPI